jgi:uncharacterized protein (DUF433 family)
MSNPRASRCGYEPEYPFSRSFGHSRSAWPKCRDGFISTAKDFDVSFSVVLRKAAKEHDCIAIDDEILGGTPRISGTRIPVYMILDAIEYYGNLEGALKSYPQLSIDQVKEAVCFAGEVLEHPVDYESETSAG